MRFILFIFLLLFATKNFCQESFLRLENFLKNDEKVDFILPITNNESNHFSLFFINSKKSTNYLFDVEGSLLSEFSSEIENKAYENYLGNIFWEDSVILFFSNQSKSKIFAWSFDFKEKKAQNLDLELRLKNERFLFTFEKNAHLYIITLKEEDSNFKVYTFDKDGNTNQKEIKAPPLDYRNSQNKVVTLSEFLKERVDINDDFVVPFIEDHAIASMNITRHLMKAYPTEMGCAFLVDKSKNMTYLFDFNLNSNQVDGKRFLSAFLPSGLANGQSNSYLLDELLFQISTNPKELSISIKNSVSQKELKRYVLTMETFFETLNPHGSTQVSNSKENKKEIAKLLRALNTFSIGISAKEIDDATLQIDFGSHMVNYESPEEAGLRSSLLSFGLAGGLLYALLTNSTSTNSAFLQYNNKAIINLNFFMNTDFKIIDGKTSPCIFESIRLQEEKFAKNIVEGAFKMNNLYYYVLYHQKDNYLKINKYGD